VKRTCSDTDIDSDTVDNTGNNDNSIVTDTSAAAAMLTVKDCYEVCLTAPHDARTALVLCCHVTSPHYAPPQCMARNTTTPSFVVLYTLCPRKNGPP